jgi:ribosomal protein S4
MPRRPPHSLKRGLIRMSWNKFNLYNLIKQQKPLDTSNLTLYQQKWHSKKVTRAYHGDRLTEKRWQRVFDPKLQVGGKIGEDVNKRVHAAALMYEQLERRLDVLVFRCLFAQSVYAARQMVSHGKVTVNGVKMAYPSHRVKDGDVIRVQPQAIRMLTNAQDGVYAYSEPAFSAPFMFLPDYLQVNYPTCSAVFLRSPKWRLGRVEIPSPHPPDVHALAHEFYARKRRG